jgi:hypothetical protein
LEDSLDAKKIVYFQDFKGAWVVVLKRQENEFIQIEEFE